MQCDSAVVRTMKMTAHCSHDQKKRQMSTYGDCQASGEGTDEGQVITQLGVGAARLVPEVCRHSVLGAGD